MEIVEGDLYSHLGTNVRMSPSKFQGRLKVIETALRETEESHEQDTILPTLRKYHDFLIQKFQQTIRGFN